MCVATPTEMAETGSREQLTRDRIVRAAVNVIERDGEDAISMRRIAAELQCAVMSLYNHVPNKDALLDAVAEYIMAGFEFAVDSQADWPDQARALVRAFRDISRRYPRCINVVIMRQLNTAAGLQPLESALATARAAGFDGEVAVRIMRTFVAYALGSLVNEARLARVRLDRAADPHGYAARVDADQFPNIAELSGTLLRFDHEADFEFGLELLISAVAGLPRTQE
jgi:AcrR family transcriptional regulator